MTDAPPRTRVAVLLPYWSFWERSVGFDLRADRRRRLDDAVAGLTATHDVVVAALLGSPEDGARAAAEARERGAGVVVVVQTMAAPPTHTTAALDALPGVAVVVWVAAAAPTHGGADHQAITTDGGTVGGPMLTSMLVRQGRPFALVVGPAGVVDLAAEIDAAGDAGRQAGGLRRARVGRIGRPLDGYACVELDDDLLHRRTGITMVPMEARELRDAFEAVTDARVGELLRDTRAAHAVAADAEPGLAGSLRAALALEDLTRHHRLDAGTLNCHVPEIRLAPPIHLAPCFALGRMTTLGVPWTCVGDALTAVAMLISSRVGGSSQYHELEHLRPDGQLVIASSGEHDGRLASGATTVIRNGWFPDDPGCGVCVRAGIAAGPATLVALAHVDVPAPTLRLVVARGHFTGDAWPGVGTVSGGFRFACEPASAAWGAWARAGANHHSAAVAGDIAEPLAQVAAHLGMECAVVG